MLINSNPLLTAQSRDVEKKTVKNCPWGKIVKVHGNLIFSPHIEPGRTVNKGAVFLPCLADYDFHFLIVGLSGMLSIRL